MINESELTDGTLFNYSTVYKQKTYVTTYLILRSFSISTQKPDFTSTLSSVRKLFIIEKIRSSNSFVGGTAG